MAENLSALIDRLGRVGLDQATSSGLLLLGLTGLTLGGLYSLHRWLHPNLPQHQQIARWLRLESFRSPRSGELPLASALILLICLGLFGLLSLGVVLGNPLSPIDQALTAGFQQLRSVSLEPWVVGLTLLGDSFHLVLLGLVLCLNFILNRNRAAAWLWIGATLTLLLLNPLLKLSFAIPRPEILIQPLQSLSFPSGHSSNSMLFIALLTTFLAQQLPYPRRWWVYSPAAMLALGIGLSRIYLGVHWFSDVLGGWLLGLAVCAASRLIYSRFDRQPVSFNRPWLWLAGLALSAAYLSTRLSGAVIGYLPASF